LVNCGSRKRERPVILIVAASVPQAVFFENCISMSSLALLGRVHPENCIGLFLLDLPGR
jgi:hypothetical protein